MSREIKFKAWDKKLNNMFDNVAHTPNGRLDWIMMQFTGLKDKNGKEIYEGDIVKFDCIETSSGDGEYNCIGEVKCSDLGNLTYRNVFVRFAKNVKVIGNIHENPELLEKV